MSEFGKPPGEPPKKEALAVIEPKEDKKRGDRTERIAAISDAGLRKAAEAARRVADGIPAQQPDKEGPWVRTKVREALDRAKRILDKVSKGKTEKK